MKKLTNRQLFSFLMASFFSWNVVGLENVEKTEKPPFTMRPAALYADETAEPLILGGVKSDPDDWPATLVFNVFKKPCTSTVIGPKVILTAAHCVTDGVKGTLEYGNNERDVSCYHHPDYDPSDPHSSADFSLCFSDKEITKMRFENVSKDISIIKRNQKIRLLGFGCNSDNGIGTLYEGDAEITTEAIPPDYHILISNGAAVCSGDSGGGAYLLINPPINTRRVLVSVNSISNNEGIESWLSITTAPGFISWALKEAKDRGVKICGLFQDVSGCRTI